VGGMVDVLSGADSFVSQLAEKVLNVVLILHFVVRWHPRHR
jgi:hypothetical protein